MKADMEMMTFDEFIQEVEEDRVINIFNVEMMVEQLLQSKEEEDFEDNINPRRKLRQLANLFADAEIKVYGTADNYHNCAVPYAKNNMYDCACLILKRGLDELGAAVDLVADYIKYGIFCGKYMECETFYHHLNEIPKEEWNWRAFSFSLDYLLDKLNRVREKKARSILKRTAIKLSNQFVLKIGNDQAYFDKAEVLRICGSINEETEESVLQTGIGALKVAPKCALRMSDILFERGEYKQAAELLRKCCINALRPQPDINGGYAFFLSALSKASYLFDTHSERNFDNNKDDILDIYRDFNTALESRLPGTYRGTADTVIKIIEAQTEIDYPYTNAGDIYDFG